MKIALSETPKTGFCCDEAQIRQDTKNHTTNKQSAVVKLAVEH